MPTMLKSPTITPKKMKRYDIEPVHPGELLDREFLQPMDLSQRALARAIKVPPRRINEIVLGKRAITADTALRLARYFGTSAQFWLNLQSGYELRLAEAELADLLDEEITPHAA